MDTVQRGRTDLHLPRSRTRRPCCDTRSRFLHTSQVWHLSSCCGFTSEANSSKHVRAAHRIPRPDHGCRGFVESDAVSSGRPEHSYGPNRDTRRGGGPQPLPEQREQQ